VQITKNIVSALVDGSRSTPYKVRIKVPEFSKSQIATIQEIVNNSTLILSSLVKKKLPEQLLDNLRKNHISLFPTKWNELSASCSCPDWAMPCKHLAALLYVMSDEIDKNPFTLFSLRGCNLLRMIDDFKDGNLEKEQQVPKLDDILHDSYIETLGTAVKNLSATGSIESNSEHSTDAQLDMPTDAALKDAKISEVLDNTANTNISENAPSLNAGEEEQVPFLDPACLDAVSFGGIDDLLENIMQILSCENPLFYEKDFPKILETCYKHWRTHMKISRDMSAPTGKNSEEEIFFSKWGDPAQVGEFSIDLSHTHGVSKIIAGDLFQREPYKTAMARFFLNLPSSYLHKLCYSLRFMHIISIFAGRLIEKSAIIPQVMQNDSGITFIRWIPALFDQSVKNTCWRLAKMCPPDLVTYQNKSLCPLQQVISATSLFIAALTQENFPRSLDKHAENNIFRLFFSEKPLLPSKNIAEREIPSSVSNWLSRLFMFDKRHKLYLLVNDHGHNSFSLDVRVLVGGVPVSLATAFESKNMKLSLLSELCSLFEYLPELESTVDSNQSVIFDTKEFTRIFMHVLPLLRSVGIEVILPKSLRNLLRPRIVLNMRSSEKVSSLKSFVNMESMVDFDWRIAVGSKELTIEEFRELVSKFQGLIEIRDEYVILDEKEISQLLEKADNLPETMDYSDFMQAVLANEIDGAEVNMDEKLASLFNQLTQIEPTALPENLCATMRPYQERGFNWLMQNIKLGFGSILADDMGLGKTLQVVAVILALKNDGVLNNKQKVLIIAPTSLLSNWQKEFEKFAPSVRLFVYHGQNRKDEPIPNDIDVLITSYGLVRRDMKDLNKNQWFLIVIDEAQNIKNPKTAQSKSIKGVNAMHKIAMSGTPVENRLTEYWSIFDFTNKNYLGSQKTFVRRYASPIERNRDAHSLELFKKV
ncbi:MAG: DEAD/DEAH box helicase, partial [Holosporales bacterium]|nr:DEAD/DEAH box helicase [Holosporales bacterium]